MKFTKMHGAGNDFIIINNIEEQLPLKCFGELAKKLCNRRLSIGADGLMVVERATLQSKCREVANFGNRTFDCNEAEAYVKQTTSCDFRMIFYNADGSEGEMCGNGARCIARYGYENGLAGSIQRIETISGIVEGERLSEKLYRVKLNPVTRMEMDCVVIPNTHMALNCLSYPTVRGELNGKEEFATSDLSCTRVCANNAQEMLKVSYVELGTPGLPHAVVEFKGVKSIVESLRASGGDVSAAAIYMNDANAENATCRETGSDVRETSANRNADAKDDKINCSLSELKDLGKALRYHEAFPRGANVNFYEIDENETLHNKFENGENDGCEKQQNTEADNYASMRRTFVYDVYVLTYERGVEDFTLACDTGVASTAAVLTKQGILDGIEARVHVVGGDLAVDVEGVHLYLTGEAELVAEGEILHT